MSTTTDDLPGPLARPLAVRGGTGGRTDITLTYTQRWSAANSEHLAAAPRSFGGGRRAGVFNSQASAPFS